MLSKPFRIFLLMALSVAASSIALGQAADGRTPLVGPPREDERPKSLKESMEKMRIEKDKKDYAQMLERGEEALKISEELENAYAANGRLSDRELAKLESVEKLVRKIRSGLGGDDDSDDKSDKAIEQPLPPEEAVKSFRSTMVKLFDELKKTSRFSISAAAIQTSNAVIKLARFLRIKN